MDTYKTSNDKSAVSKSPPAPSSPEEELRSKQSELDRVQAEIARANVLQADIKVLQAKIAEVRQLVGAYDAKKLQDRLDDGNRKITTKIGIAEAALKDKKGKIDDAITEFDKNLREQETDEEEALTAKDAAGTEATKADGVAKTAQSKYEDVRKRAGIFDTWLNEIKMLLDQADKMEAQKDYVALYFFAREAKTVAENFTDDYRILPNDQYKRLLDTELSNSENARVNAGAKRRDADQALKDYNEVRKNYDAAKASRRANLLSALEKLRQDGLRE